MFCPSEVHQVIDKYKVRTFKKCRVAVAMAKRDGMRIGRKFVRK